MTRIMTPNQALAHADLIVDRAALQQAITAMARVIAEDYRDQRPVYLTIMHGALPFAGHLAIELGTFGQELNFDYLHATRYGGRSVGGGLKWRHYPQTPLSGRRVLLVDDILDEGHTLCQVRNWCLAQHASDVRIAVLAVKRHDRCVEGLSADYVGVEVPDRYVFGFGMDFEEHLRTLPAIYALRDS